jgi:hypothetical protein
MSEQTTAEHKPAETAHPLSRKSPKPPKPRKVERRRRGRKG